MVTYSFKDTSGGFNDPDVGFFPFSGQIGMGEFTVAMATEWTAHDTASDGNVMISAMVGDSGSVDIRVQQTSALHAFLLSWANAKKINLQQGNATNWAGATLTLRNIVDGSSHYCTGVSPSKIPDKTYGAQGGYVTWRLMCGDVQNTTVGA